MPSVDDALLGSYNVMSVGRSQTSTLDPSVTAVGSGTDTGLAYLNSKSKVFSVDEQLFAMFAPSPDTMEMRIFFLQRNGK